jgi:hypothetical protein
MQDTVKPMLEYIFKELEAIKAFTNPVKSNILYRQGFLLLIIHYHEKIKEKIIEKLLSHNIDQKNLLTFFQRTLSENFISQNLQKIILPVFNLDDQKFEYNLKISWDEQCKIMSKDYPYINESGILAFFNPIQKKQTDDSKEYFVFYDIYKNLVEIRNRFSHRSEPFDNDSKYKNIVAEYSEISLHLVQYFLESFLQALTINDK